MKPKSQMDRTFSQLFGIKYASNIQRLCYNPKTKNIYTFIEFLDIIFSSYSI